MLRPDFWELLCKWRNAAPQSKELMALADEIDKTVDKEVNEAREDGFHNAFDSLGFKRW